MKIILTLTILAMYRYKQLNDKQAVDKDIDKT